MNNNVNQHLTIDSQPDWEQNLHWPYDPQEIIPRATPQPTLAKQPYNTNNCNHLSTSDIQLVDPKQFIAHSWKTIGSHEMWNQVFQNHTDGKILLNAVLEGIDITQHFQKFNGRFKGQQYNAQIPPQFVANNHHSCEQYADFIFEQLQQDLLSGALICLGRTDSVLPPRCVLPMQIETSKPRLIQDARFVNLFTQDKTFNLKGISEPLSWLTPGSLLITIDEKSGYHQGSISPNSYTYFGVQFAGYYFQYTVPVFGYKLSAYYHQSIGEAVRAFITGQYNIPSKVYLDDRLCAPQQFLTQQSCTPMCQAQNSAFLYVNSMANLGYILNGTKSKLTPALVQQYIGFIIDTEQCTLAITQKRVDDIEQLAILLSEQQLIDYNLMESFIGKAISSAQAIPNARLFLNACYHALTLAKKRKKHTIPASSSITYELQFWKNIRSISGSRKWLPETHTSLDLQVFTDASHLRWGAIITQNDKQHTFSAIWPDHLRSIEKKNINVLELYAVYYLVLTASEQWPDDFRDIRLDIHVDNTSAIAAILSQGTTSPLLLVPLRLLFQLLIDKNIVLNAQYVNTKENIADAPSRLHDKYEFQLLPDLFTRLLQVFPTPTVDAFASALTTQMVNETPLPFYSQFLEMGTRGVNAFAHDLRTYMGNREYVYAYPPAPLVAPFIRLLQEQRATALVIIPQNIPIQPAWPIWMSLCTSAIIIAPPNCPSARYPTKTGWAVKCFPYAIWALAFDFS